MGAIDEYGNFWYRAVEFRDKLKNLMLRGAVVGVSLNSGYAYIQSYVLRPESIIVQYDE